MAAMDNKIRVLKSAVLLALMMNLSFIVSLKTSYKSVCYVLILPVIELCPYGIYAFTWFLQVLTLQYIIKLSVDPVLVFLQFLLFTGFPLTSLEGNIRFF
jgi:hypothetical protein